MEAHFAFCKGIVLNICFASFYLQTLLKWDEKCPLGTDQYGSSLCILKFECISFKQRNPLSRELNALSAPQSLPTYPTFSDTNAFWVQSKVRQSIESSLLVFDISHFGP